LLVLPLLVVGVFFAYPILEMFRLSFTDFIEPGGAPLDNYTWFLGDETQRTILLRTITVGLTVTIACLLIGFPYAYFMTVVGPKGRLLMLAVILLPFWTSLLVRLYAWVILLQPSGPILTVLKSLGFTNLKILGTSWAVGIGSVQVLLPFLVLPLYASISTIDHRLLQAAESLGAKPRKAFFGVYLPLATPGILAGSTLVFVFMLGFYFTPAFLGSTRNSLISEQIVNQTSRLLAFGRGGAMALVLLVIALLLLGSMALLTRRVNRNIGIGEDRD
jgi:putative spermidine/putrescine transport system permease protein